MRRDARVSDGRDRAVHAVHRPLLRLVRADDARGRAADDGVRAASAAAPHRPPHRRRLDHFSATISLDSLHRRRSEEHTSELQSHVNLVCRLLLEKKNKPITELISSMTTNTPWSA